MDKIIAGALFDFAGHLTTMEKEYTVGGSYDASRMVEELKTFAKKRDLSLNDADVKNWNMKVKL